jgi:hypothetical protein
VDVLSGAALAGIVTLHLLMPQVLDNYPERRQADVDGYIAVMDCQEIGRRFVLELDGQAYLVAAADCAAPRDRAHIERAFAGEWMADVELELWGDLPRFPQRARLWPERLWRMARARVDRVM